ncbi:PHP domain-like protein [Fomitiporia mediterranea MF3/22]|uniref:PHP domain-like protein n=1 Tax=Fomitiporia mediterranea (strain MF3/22) TaxID=694068 RepID=UPI0004409A30|nr:PHP domain-like protein [Fomitiporia mediterranea MF3/22]EJD08501.1 PHP domain-like protein [Fomitiporia mediterranea MF3/22]
MVTSKVDPRSHVNILDPLLKQLRKGTGILFLKRLTIVLDEDSEKGNGLSTGNTSLFTSYDILSLHPTTQASLASACLTHTQPSPLTTHIISLPLTSPRLPFRLKHTLVRTAIKNGAVFEIDYAGALGGGGTGGLGEDCRRNWWAAARELARVTKGKGLIVSGGVDDGQYLRAPRDVANLITLLGLAQNFAHDAATTTPKSLLLRAQTRKTYRAVLSEPTLIMPMNQQQSSSVDNQDSGVSSKPTAVPSLSADADIVPQQNSSNADIKQQEAVLLPTDTPDELELEKASSENKPPTKANGAKRPFEALGEEPPTKANEISGDVVGHRHKKKKKRAKAAAGINTS